MKIGMKTEKPISVELSGWWGVALGFYVRFFTYFT
jgi:hypothetical protein